MKRVPCSLEGCTFLASVPNEWRSERKAYCTEVHRYAHEFEMALYGEGAKLGHPKECPGCAGSGVEDNSRWGGELALCSWPQLDGSPVSGELARTMSRCPDWRCACGLHIMHAKRDGTWVMELDDQGRKHGFERCPPDGPPDECVFPPHGWRCTRGFHAQGPCAVVPVEPATIPHQVWSPLHTAVVAVVSFLLGALAGAVLTAVR